MSDDNVRWNLSLIATLALMAMASSCRAADSDLARDFVQKAGRDGLGLIRVLNFISDEITFEPMNRAQHDPFSWWYLMNNTTSPDATSIIGVYDTLESGRKWNHPPPEDLLSGRVKHLPPGIVCVNASGQEMWNRPVQFHVANIAITTAGDKVALQGKEGLAYLLVASGELHILDSTAGESHCTSHRIAWSPVGDEIVYERDGNVLIRSLSSKQPKKFAAGFDPSWSPDGRWIAFRSREGSGVLVTPSGKETKVVLSGKKLSGALRWSPDSEYLLCSESDAADLPARLLTELKSRLVIYRIRDGAEYTIVSAIPVGIGEAFEWIVKRPKPPQ